jgi:hypothetical protein
MLMDMTAESDAIIDEARAAVAAGREPDWDALRARIEASAPDGEGRRRALQQLERVLAVHRARARVAQPPAPAAAPAPPRRPLLRSRPTISGNMDVRRHGDATLEWDAAPAVTSWEVRFSERPDPRREYVVRETRTLAAAETVVDVPLGDLPLRVHLLGRGRDGRLVRRAIISALTRATWRERWQRRATAS